MDKRQTAYGILSAMGILALILDGKTALMGATDGIELCLRTLIPALFPFIVLSNLLTSSLSTLPLLRPLGNLCGAPKGSEGILAAGFLGGYPVGAQCVGEAWKSRQISRNQAETMMSYCSNAGPSFLFGILGRMFRHPGAPWVLWGIHILSAILAAQVFSREKTGFVRTDSKKSPSLPESLTLSLNVMGRICGWVVLFRVLIAFLERWILWAAPDWFHVVVSGILELSNACCMLLKIENPSLRFLIAAGLLSQGGLCVTMQTCSVTSGLSLCRYLPGKLLQTVWSLTLSSAVILLNGAEEQAVLYAGILGAGIIIIVSIDFLLRKMQNSSSNSLAVGV